GDVPPRCAQWRIHWRRLAWSPSWLWRQPCARIGSLMPWRRMRSAIRKDSRSRGVGSPTASPRSPAARKIHNQPREIHVIFPLMSALSPYGLFELPFWGYVVVTFATIQLMFLGITLYLHRDQSHGGLILHPILRHVFRFWLWFSSGVVTREWVAVHRRHHAYADRQGDPHSPVVHGLKRVVLEGYELYKAATLDPAILRNYGKGTPSDWIERNVYSRFPNWGLVLFSLSMLILFGIPAILMVAIHLIAQPFFAGGVVNGLGHAVGYRSFEMPSTATNLAPWGVLLGGEELHNNHHAFPRSARFAVQRWEFDIGWFWICAFRAVGLAKVRYVAPRPRLERERSELDADTVHALF